MTLAMPIHRLVATLVLSIYVTTAGWMTTARGQELPKAVVAFRVELAALMNDKLVQEFQDEALEGAIGPEQERVMEIAKQVTSITGQMAAPAEFHEAMVNEIQFMVSVNFANPEAAKREFGSLPGFQDVQIDGRAYKQFGGENAAGGPPMPTILARLNEKSVDIGTKAYVSSGQRNFATPALIATYRKLPSSALRVAVDFDGAKGFVNQSVDTIMQQADPISKELVRVLRQVKTAGFHADPNADVMLGFLTEAYDAEKATAIKDKLDALLGLARTNLGDAPTPAMREVATALFDGIKTTLDGNQASLRVNKPEGWEEHMQVAINEARKNAVRVSDANNFRMVAIAVHNYADTHREFPFGRLEDRPLHRDLSWRVALLPYMENVPLYDRFDLESGWDSDQNKPLAKQKIAFYTMSNGAGISWIQPENPPKSFRDILDGTANTVMLLENPNAGKQPWTKPSHLSIDEVVKLVKTLPDGQAIHAALYDGSVRRLSNKTDEETLKRLFNPNDGQAIEARSIRAD